MTDEMIQLGGENFIAQRNGCLEWEIWMQARITEAGLSRITTVKGETADQFAERMIAKALSSGKALVLLGGLMLPEGKSPDEWTPAMAADITRRMGKLRTAEDKEAAKGAIAAMLIGFFQNGFSSLKNSPSFSTQTGSREPITAAAETQTESPPAGAA